MRAPPRHTPTRARSTMSASEGKSPADFLKAIKGKTVLVKLNTGVDYRGASRRVDAGRSEMNE